MKRFFARRNTVAFAPLPIARRKSCSGKVLHAGARHLRRRAARGPRRTFRVVPLSGWWLCRAGAARGGCFPRPVLPDVCGQVFQIRLAAAKRRIENTDAREIDLCCWWLELQFALVEAPLIETLGASALRAVAGPSARLWRYARTPGFFSARARRPTVDLLDCPPSSDPAGRGGDACFRQRSRSARRSLRLRACGRTEAASQIPMSRDERQRRAKLAKLVRRCGAISRGWAQNRREPLAPQ